MLRRLSFSMSAWALSLVFGVGFCLAPSARAEAALKVAEIFSDNMVLQRDIQAPVWGEGTAGRRVTVRLGGQVVMATVDAQGRWLARLAPMAAGGPHVMSVADGAATLTLRNVLVGEVWLAGGQSNMEVGLAGVEGGEAAIAAADDPQLRFIPVPRTTGPLIPPKNDWSFDWKATTPQTAPMFSAVGYFYARELRKALGVPVGIIDCNYGATPVETWMSPEAMRSDPDFQPILDRYAAACKAHTPAEFDDLAREYARQWTQLKIDYGKWVKGGSVGPRPSPPRLTPGPFDYSSPSVLYGTMIKKVAPYGLRGFIWYQGESNAERAWQYRKLFPALIADWRREWQRGGTGRHAFPVRSTRSLRTPLTEVEGHLARTARGPASRLADRAQHRHGGHGRRGRPRQHPPHPQGSRGAAPGAARSPAGLRTRRGLFGADLQIHEGFRRPDYSRVRPRRRRVGGQRRSLGRVHDLRRG
ncbi:MAG: hypothetical protein M1457_06685 [bacterium]|nr:hypothetical protein [bacterium]